MFYLTIDQQYVQNASKVSRPDSIVSYRYFLEMFKGIVFEEEVYLNTRIVQRLSILSDVLVD